MFEASLLLVGSTLTFWGVFLQYLYFMRRSPLRARLNDMSLPGAIYLLLFARHGKYDWSRVNNPTDVDRFQQDAQAWTYLVFGAAILYGAAVYKSSMTIVNTFF